MREKYRRIRMASLLKPTVSTGWFAVIFILTMIMCNLVIGIIIAFTDIEIGTTICFVLAAYLGMYIPMCYVRNEKSQTKIIPISSKEWLWSYLDMYAKVIVLVTFVFVVVYAFIYILNWIGNTFYADILMATESAYSLVHEMVDGQLLIFILGIRILGINMITFGMKEKWAKVIAVIIGYIIFTVSAILELNTWYEIKPIAIPICLTLLVSIVWAVIGFVVTYYRLKPKKYVK